MADPTTVSGRLEDLLALAGREIAAGRPAAAEALCRQLVRARPDSAASWLLLAVAQTQQHRYADAIRNAESAIERASQEPRAHELVLKVLVLFGRFAHVLTHAERHPGPCANSALAAIVDEARAAIAARDAAAAKMRADGRFDLRDVTFVIPVYADSPDRVRNLRAVLAHLNRHADSTILVLEDVKDGRRVPAEWTARDGLAFAYEAVAGNDCPYFHKTWMLNRGAALSKTEIVALWDADVIADPAQIVQARDAIAGGQEAAYAYNGLSIDVGGAQLDALLATLDPERLDGFAEANAVFGIDAAGGALLLTKRVLAQAGGYNENIVCWGLEDREFLLRLQVLGIAPQRIPGPLWHLHHARTANSSDAHPFWQRNLAEFRRTEALDRASLEALVAAGHFRRPLASRADLPT